MMSEELSARLRKHGQHHLIAFWHELSAEQQQGLADQLADVDLELLDRLFRKNAQSANWAELARRAEPPPSFRMGDENNPVTPVAARKRGRAAIVAGEVGVVLVAGGQGTRLGFDKPKGLFPIGPISQASLFQILFEKILARSKAAGVPIPLYLMTSPATDAETREYLEEHKRFGLPEDDVHIFCQGTMPAVDAANGRLLLADKHRLSLSPDGHGGTLAALARSGALADMQKRGLKYLCYFQVDNPLVPVCDPEFLGYHILSGSQMSTLVVRKRTSRDKVGNVVMIDGSMQILEYSDLNPLPDDIVERKTDAGDPVFWAGSIAIHVFDVDFLLQQSEQSEALPFHVAHKAVPYVDAAGQAVTPPKPNAFKFERFIFDLLPSAQDAIVVEADESTVFAPLKNAPHEKSDTPQSVREQMMALYRSWLKAAGCQVVETLPIEISPLYAQDEEEVRGRVVPGTALDEPNYFR